jgi:ribonuclease HII
VAAGGGSRHHDVVEQLTFGEEPAAGPSAGSAGGPPAEVTGYEIERELAAAGAGRVAGVDEVGRGAWAGPVTVCAVIVRAGYPGPPAGLTDSKRLSPARRAVIAAQLLDGSHDYIGRPWPVRCAVRADLRSVSVAAASVIAKVHRDRFMAGLGYSEFAFADNAGYPAPAHQEALAALGPTPQHRLSWSYLDDLPRWRHLRKHRPDIEGQLSLM